MVVIRLARGGSKKRPFYYLTVADSRRARDSKFIERVGYYNPLARGEEQRLNVDMERINYWLTQGARTTDRIRILVKEGQLDEEKFQKLSEYRLNKRKKRLAAKAEQSAKDTPATPVEDVPSEATGTASTDDQATKAEEKVEAKSEEKVEAKVEGKAEAKVEAKAEQSAKDTPAAPVEDAPSEATGTASTDDQATKAKAKVEAKVADKAETKDQDTDKLESKNPEK